MSQIHVSFFGKLANITDAAVSVCIRFLRKQSRFVAVMMISYDKRRGDTKLK